MSLIKVAAFAVIAVALIFGGRMYNQKIDKEAQQRAGQEREKARQEEEALFAKLKIEDVVPGTQDTTAQKGDTLIVHYEGKLEDGTLFDSSYNRGTPFEFHLGAGEVIKGWDVGLLGMKVGGRRVLTIPPELGYGDSQAGKIPPNSTLKFTVELLDVVRP
jgi:peptidylprolyl isomerase